MITCNLTKLELALDQIRKVHTKLIPADAALIAGALSIAGRHAIAVYEGEHYRWPHDHEKLTHALVGQLNLVQEGIEASTPKKASKNAPEDEPIHVNVGLAPNYEAGEKLLLDRNDLKTMLSDILQDGVEYLYQNQDILWQLALERANWSTVTGHDISRRVKVKTIFTEGAVGVETGGSSTKKRATKKAAADSAGSAAAEIDDASEVPVEVEA